MAARLADIAAQAKVSEATVSRVLNGKPGVADSTRQAVLTALDVLGYERPTRLRRKSAGLVGLIVPELANPIFPAFAQVIETALARHGFTPVLCTQTPGGVHEDDYTQMLLERSVSGIIFVSGLHADSLADHERYRQLTARGLPIVLVNGYADDVEAPCVSSDDLASSELAVAHLRALGHTRIGLAVGPERFVPAIRKIAGFRQAMASVVAPADVEDLIERSLFTVEGGAAAAQRLLDRGCTAIVCGSDLMAFGAIRAARSMGLRVPEDVSVVGYDDSPLVAFTDPPLTTLRQSVQAMGEAAVRALVDEISGQPAPRAEYVFRPELVVRGSTGAVPAVVRR
ncbi:LacI family DNA-binding transcriptional regulator [Angustibacter luteus]|uniref:LacI family DNA-binding transcriptional regulator n=1 Tax=Angustibacter luteus TaxID=658456 RepID=A0ABW1JC16_9ACTN